MMGTLHNIWYELLTKLSFSGINFFNVWIFFADSISGNWEFSSSRSLAMNWLGLFKINSDLMLFLRGIAYENRVFCDTDYYSK